MQNNETHKHLTSIIEFLSAAVMLLSWSTTSMYIMSFNWISSETELTLTLLAAIISSVILGMAVICTTYGSIFSNDNQFILRQVYYCTSCVFCTIICDASIALELSSCYEIVSLFIVVALFAQLAIFGFMTDSTAMTVLRYNLIAASSKGNLIVWIIYKLIYALIYISAMVAKPFYITVQCICNFMLKQKTKDAMLLAPEAPKDDDTPKSL